MITIPPKLRQALEQDTSISAPVEAYADSVCGILEDNKMSFFPAYTDHGVRHVNNVLETEERLVPSAVWQAGLLTAKDAAVLICGTLLHDLAMHITPPGFLRLVAPNTAFKAVPWFETRKDSSDQPWPALWHEYLREVRRFSDQQLHDMFGVDPGSEVETWRVRTLPDDTGRWTRYDHLIAGEFLRRHHARLAHEIALMGFPGIERNLFPRLSTLLPDLADLAGVVARSHCLDLRVVAEYLRDIHLTRIRPRGVAAIFAMALLRVADYLQLDHGRAPTALLNLREPVSPLSAKEWEKHRIVRYVNFEAEDPQAIVLEISPQHSLQSHLQLEELLSDLQREMDHASAVLSEVYGQLAQDGLDRLRLGKTILHSNLKSTSMLASLPYIPLRSQLGADPQILGLIVEPLYGAAPEMGVRELIQNAVDAVREYRSWLDVFGPPDHTVNHPDQETDVHVEISESEGGRWSCTITDKGIGMTPDTVDSYFLKAGASFRESKEWRQTFTTQGARSRVARSGRFGIGVFASFLLGDSLTVMTRHVGRDQEGLQFKIELGQNNIELRKAPGAFHGTSIKVVLSEFNIRRLLSHPSVSPLDWYRLASPSVAIVVSPFDRKSWKIGVSDVQPDGSHELLKYPEWRCVSLEASPEVLWRTQPRGANLTVNGIRIARWNTETSRHPFQDYGLWEEPKFQFRCPGKVPDFVPPLAIVDRDALVPLTLRRDSLVTNEIPGEEDLLKDIGRDIVAWSVARAPRNSPWGSPASRLEALWGLYPLLCRREGVTPLSPFITAAGFGLIEPSLLHSIGIKVLAISGCIGGYVSDERSERKPDLALSLQDPSNWLEDPLAWFGNDFSLPELPEGVAWTTAAWLWGEEDIYDPLEQLEGAGLRFWKSVSRIGFLNPDKGYRVSMMVGTPGPGGRWVSPLAVLEELGRAGGANETEIRAKEGWCSVQGANSALPEISPSALIPGAPSYGDRGLPQRFPLLLEVHLDADSTRGSIPFVANAWLEWIGESVIPWEEAQGIGVRKRLESDPKMGLYIRQWSAQEGSTQHGRGLIKKEARSTEEE